MSSSSQSEFGKIVTECTASPKNAGVFFLFGALCGAVGAVLWNGARSKPLGLGHPPSEHNFSRSATPTSSPVVLLNLQQNSIRVWFDVLEQMRQKMQRLNTTTPSNLKSFSKKTLKALNLNSPGIQNDFVRFCTVDLELAVDEAVINQHLTNSFRVFWDDKGGKIANKLRILFFNAAQLHDPTLTLSGFGEKTLVTAFGSAPFDDNDVLQELHHALKNLVPLAFYSGDAAPLRDGAKTVNAAIAQILD